MDLDPGVEMQWAGGPRAYLTQGEAWDQKPRASNQTIIKHKD